MEPEQTIPGFHDHYENPYFLHSSDHAGLVLVSDRLSSGVEFHSWRRSVRMALNVRNKLGFIDGTIPKPPPNHRDAGSWSRCNDMVATWLMNSVSKKIAQSLLFMSTAESIWKNLLARFKQDDAPRVYEIEQRLGSIQQGSMDVTTYYTELVTLWEEYRNYVEIPVCTCGKCECNASQSWESLQQRSRVIKFLMGLNESFESSRRQILMLKPLPNIEDVFNLITQDERQRVVKPSSKVDNVVFQASGPEHPSAYTENQVFAAQHQNNYRQRQRPLCTHYGQFGHIVQKCFKLHGYPPGHRLHDGSTQQKSSHQTSTANSNQITQRSDSSNAQQLPLKINTVANVMSSTPRSGAVNLDLSIMNVEQVNNLIHQLQRQVRPSAPLPPAHHASITDGGYMDPQSSTGIIPCLSTNLRYEHQTLTFHHQCLSTLYNSLPSGSWILDSGATTHVCSDLARFSDLSPVVGVTVSLPNGVQEIISHIGTIHLSPTIVLHKVLHVPSFQFNLISINTLIKDAKCSAHFYPEYCLLQESIQGSMIGRGTLTCNLYVLDTVDLPSVNLCGTLQVDGHLWHQRLGHPSLNKLQFIPGILSVSKSSSTSIVQCPVCPLAKQKRLPFVSHNHLADKLFDIVHLDIWGPFSVESTEGYRYFLTIVDDCTRVTWIYFLRNKSDVSTIFPSFLTHVKTQYNSVIKCIRSDNAPELAFPHLVKTHGIVHQFSCASTTELCCGTKASAHS